MKFQKTPISTAISAALAGLCLAPGAAALAQDVAMAANVSEILVTSTRRSETAQDVPINITAFGGDAIETLGIEDVDDAAKLVPGLTLVDQGPRGTTASSCAA